MKFDKLEVYQTGFYTRQSLTTTVQRTWSFLLILFKNLQVRFFSFSQSVTQDLSYIKLKVLKLSDFGSKL